MKEYMKIITFKRCLAVVIYGLTLAVFGPVARSQYTGGPPSTSLPTSADGGALGSGQLNFQPDLFTGRFTYSVPIVVPPARQNSQPNLGLTYNSSVGNGICGVGWKFEIGKIERQTRYGVPVLRPASGSPTQYDDSKSFTVDFCGTEGDLVRVSPNGQSPAEYRLRVDTTFLKFLYYNQVSNAYWTVVDKSGAQYYFGEGTSNRVDNPNLSGLYGTNTFRWQLDRVVDFNGNATYITYTNMAFGSGANTTYQLCPWQVSYNGNINSPAISATDTITFLYTNRADQTLSFISGCRMESRELLRQIIVQANGQKVRRYALNYISSPSTMRSLLASVQTYGTDDSSSLPPVSFTYQVQQFAFGPKQRWPIYSEAITTQDWNSIGATDGNGGTYVKMVDMDGDGLPDRVLRSTNYPYNTFIVQRNTGSGFVGNYIWGGLNNQGQNNTTWGSVAVTGNAEVGEGGGVYAYNNNTACDLFDINGDGKADRVMNNLSVSTNWWVQINGGNTNGFMTETNWGLLSSSENYVHSEYDLWYYTLNPQVTIATATDEMIDLNGDGLVDREIGNTVQFNTGNGFSPAVSFPGLANTEYSASTPYTFAEWQQIDLNGDGLPDVVALPPNNYYQYTVNFNDGMQMETANSALLGDTWGTNNYELPGYLPMVQNWCVSSLAENGTYGTWQLVQLIDMNGDGLPDRVMTEYSAPYTQFWVQLNTGSGFSPNLVEWTGVDSEAGSSYQWWNSPSFSSGSQALVTMMDINGDGLPDRVITEENAPYTNLWVQLNLGPFPDLMCGISNGIGGSVQITYTPSTRYDNTDRIWTNDPWAEGAQSLLPFPIYTVSTIAVNDGMGNTTTNAYAYTHGRFDSVSREFCGFNRVAVTDQYGGKTVTYFHQSGGFDDSADGEYQDQGSFSKQGMPYRAEVWGTNGLLFQIVLSKVQECNLNTNGWYFPYVSQSIVMTYEGLASYRATAKQFVYDTNAENLIAESDLGEVSNIVFNGQSFTDIGNDSVYTWITYTNFSRPADVKITSDSAGANRLRETLMTYDSRGNLTGNKVWLDTAGNFITTTATSYDQYGNPNQATDAAGITTTTIYDSTYRQYPITQITGTFTNQFAYDVKSGTTLLAIDAKGLVASNSFDVFFRPTASYISTNAYGSPVLWKTKTSYALGGISGGISSNYVHKQVNDAVDTVNGFETYTYLDGISRTLQIRAESETSGQFRVANVSYDLCGNVYFKTIPFFDSGSGFTKINGNYLGTLTMYDAIGRSYQVIQAVQGTFATGILASTNATGGDTGSPVGTVTIAYVDSSNPWANVVTDSEGKVKKSYRDAYGRTIQVTEVTSGGNYNTYYNYDLLSDLTKVTDNASNQTAMTYDSLGRKTATTDPDTGTWTYAYDNAGRATQQTDARTNTVRFFYADSVGRLTSKQIFNMANALVGTVTYTYDTSDDPNYKVFPGQLYKVTDLQGYQRSSYDVRGRVIKTARFLSVNAMEYVTQTTYDDADRVQTLTYPGNAATIKYTYDTAGNLAQVKSLAGTGTQEIFYTPQSFNPLGQLTGYTDGAGVVTTNIYFANSKRLQRVWVGNGTNNLQDLTYTYDTVSDLKSISDNVYAGSASASISSISYDDLHRVTSVNSTARGTKTYGYNSIGNMLTNQDFGGGLYQYGAQPHAVTSANGLSYSYDTCGNMIMRGNQTLAYDEQNQLTSVSTTNGTVRYGYNDAGERLWRCGTNGYSVWIGGIYEINNGKALCHVFAGGKRIATFEPLCGGLWSKVVGEKIWYIASTKAGSIFNWPFQNGRGQWTMLGGTWVAALGVCMVAGRKVRIKHYEVRKVYGNSLHWKQLVTLISMSAFLLASTPEVFAAPAYNPVFYYYHNDNLGSSNVLTDRSGQMVQHYEYATFGQSSYQNNTSAYQASNRYTGQIADDETGLYYYHARYYDPQSGRFIQPDSIVPSPDAPQTLNRYSYCDNNSLNLTDPSGHHSLFGKLFGGLGNVFNMLGKPSTWESVGIGLCLGGPIGAAITLGVAVASTTVAYYAGAKAGMITGAVLSIGLAGYGISQGVGMLGTNNAQAICAIAGSALAIGSASASLAGANGVSTDLGYASLGMSVLSVGNKIPLVGGMVGAAQQVVAGAINTTLGLATFGLSGTLSLGGEQFAGGLGDELNILARDLVGGIFGVMGKVYVTIMDIADLVSFGEVTMPGRSVTGGKFLAQFALDIVIPDYGAYGGPSWGTTQWKDDPSMAVNSQDQNNLWHDLHLGNTPGASWHWDVMNFSPVPAGEVPPGPIGSAYALIGFLPFAAVGALGY
jgi:RHS repeat-associated protein